MLSAKKNSFTLVAEGPKEEESENIENYNTSPQIPSVQMEVKPQSTKILTTNFQKKESHTKYMAISFEKSSPYNDVEEEEV